MEDGLRGKAQGRGSFGDEDDRMQHDAREAPIAAAQSWPRVPYTPIRCPDCGENRVRYGGRYGRTRCHKCGACGCKFKSWQTDEAGENLATTNERHRGFP